jgi:hypothetical protein
MRQELIDDPEEFADVEWFGEIRASSGSLKPLDLARGCVGAQYDDRNRTRQRVVSKLLQHDVTIDVGQVKIQQDECRPMLPGELEAQATLHRRNDVDVAALNKYPLDEREVGEIVLNVEHNSLRAAG